MSDTSLNRFPVNIEDEMKRSYMDYAMSVIIGRALPDVRDGLKPAHRRVLYAMRQMGLASNRPYRKCAKIVGEVIGNYHPHGDAPAYDTLVRLAQDFNLRYVLVDGQGNFGSVDGDPPAAYRYTEARLESLAEEMMADLDKETVDFVPNFDETTEEPTVLPTPFPNLLVNGSAGIAVGMATNIPPHNMREVIDGVIAVIERRGESRDAKFKALLKTIPGPDFPTAGFIVGRQGIFNAYQTGRGAITLRARSAVEESKKGDKVSIVITEIPYQVNKARLIEKMADLARDKTIEGISDLRDESDRDGMRIVVELRRGEVPEVVLNNLYKHTQLQTTFGIIMLAIVAGRPRVLPLVDIIEQFIEFRREVVRRRTEFELRKAEARAHILEGLKIALDRLDEVIKLIRGSKNPAEARQGLIAEFRLSQLQAQAILDMQLQRLTGLERQKIADELAGLLKVIERLRAILSSDELLMQVVMAELKAVREEHSDPRRSEIIEETGELRIEDLIADEDMAITVTNTGYIKRTAISTYRMQRRGGKGRIGMRTREEDFVSHLFIASTHAYIMIFSDRGRAYWLKVHEIPDAGAGGKGKAIANLVAMEEGEKIAALLAVRDWPEADDQQYVVMGTRRGVIKKTDLRAFANPRAGGINAMGVEDGDAVIAVELSDGKEQVFLGTRDGMAIRFEETDVRRMGRGAYGVRGISLREGDEVVAMEIVREAGTLLTVAQNGYGKRTELSAYRLQSRGGFGTINIQTSDRNGKVVGIAYVTDDDQVMLISQQGMILRTRVGAIRSIGRATQGVRLIEMDEGDEVVAVAKLAEKEEEEESGNGEAPAPPTEPSNSEL
ncbi:MAG: DNA gyrase subunit A [Acidobacteria bacterium RIFCSPLOWO2_02_FULL_67_36]|nr:MAG: DNA gyrase subunit A [Acidobacteria bacterium RIFCSPLOWO2_02_FULL_67_36]OFW22907.1 MAG: DNA gyrase subunit A [Acidobacteria bacterium RIFCSPLOWO2_12_FULL_66_21]